MAETERESPHPQPPNTNRSTTPISEAFRDFIQTGWATPAPDLASPAEQARYAAERRQRLSALYPGVSVVIPAGDTKTRSNDTDYPYRPHTAFSYLTGWGSDTVPGSVLVGLPEATGHRWTVLFRPPAARTSDEFYADSAIGEFWTGPRPGLGFVADRLGVPTRDLAEWPAILLSLAAPAVVRDADAGITRALDAITGRDTELDGQLARDVSEMRLVKDAWEIEQMRQAIDATNRGFYDIVEALPAAIGHDRGERIIEGAFHQRARLDGNDTGYGTIAASGPHACILHWVSNDGPVRPGDLLLVDAGVELDTLYTADITRTLPVRGVFGDIQRRVYQAVLDAADAALATVRPGVRFRQVHEAAMAVIAARLDEWGFLPVSLEESLDSAGQQHRRFMIHGTSHHVGLDVHDCAQARRELYLEGELQAGMVFTIEPGLYFQPDDETVPPQWRGIGVRIEDNILVTADGAENLSAAIPRGIDEVEAWVQSAAAR